MKIEEIKREREREGEREGKRGRDRRQREEISERCGEVDGYRPAM